MGDGVRGAIEMLRAVADHRVAWPDCLCGDFKVLTGTPGLPLGQHDAACLFNQDTLKMRAAATDAERQLWELEARPPAPRAPREFY